MDDLSIYAKESIDQAQVTAAREKFGLPPIEEKPVGPERGVVGTAFKNLLDRTVGSVDPAPPIASGIRAVAETGAAATEVGAKGLLKGMQAVGIGVPDKEGLDFTRQYTSLVTGLPEEELASSNTGLGAIATAFAMVPVLGAAMKLPIKAIQKVAGKGPLEHPFSKAPETVAQDIQSAVHSAPKTGQDAEAVLAASAAEVKKGGVTPDDAAVLTGQKDAPPVAKAAVANAVTSNVKHFQGLAQEAKATKSPALTQEALKQYTAILDTPHLMSGARQSAMAQLSTEKVTLNGVKAGLKALQRLQALPPDASIDARIAAWSKSFADSKTFLKERLSPSLQALAKDINAAPPDQMNAVLEKALTGSTEASTFAKFNDPIPDRPDRALDVFRSDPTLQEAGTTMVPLSRTKPGVALDTAKGRESAAKHEAAFKSGEGSDNIVVQANPDGSFTVLSGNGRLEGAMRAGKSTLPAHVFTPATHALSDAEKAGLKALIAEGKSPKQAVQVAQMNAISDTLKALKTPQDLLKNPDTALPVLTSHEPMDLAGKLSNDASRVPDLASSIRDVQEAVAAKDAVATQTHLSKLLGQLDTAASGSSEPFAQSFERLKALIQPGNIGRPVTPEMVLETLTLVPDATPGQVANILAQTAKHVDIPAPTRAPQRAETLQELNPVRNTQAAKAATKQLVLKEFSNKATPFVFRGTSEAELQAIAKEGRLQVGVDAEGVPGISAATIDPQGFPVYGDGVGIVAKKGQYTDSGRAGEVLLNEATNPNDLQYIVNNKVMSFEEMKAYYATPAAPPQRPAVTGIQQNAFPQEFPTPDTAPPQRTGVSGIQQQAFPLEFKPVDTKAKTKRSSVQGTQQDAFPQAPKGATMGEAFQWYTINQMINYGSSLVNLGTTLTMAPLEYVARLGAGRYTALKQFAGKTPAPGSIAPGEANAAVYGAMASMWEALGVAGRVARTGQREVGTAANQLPIEHALNARTIPNAVTPSSSRLLSDPASWLNRGVDFIGQATGSTTRLLLAGDQFIALMAKRGATYAKAYRDAYEEQVRLGHTTDQFKKNLSAKVDEYLTNPASDIEKQGNDFADYFTFNNDLGPTGQSLQELVDKGGPVARVMVQPFFRTLANSATRTIEYSPGLHLLTHRFKESLKASDPAERQLAHARAMVGASLVAGGVGLTMNGVLNGAAPSNPTLKKQLQARGFEPYSITVADGSHVKFDDLGVMGNFLRMSTNVAALFNLAEQDNATLDEGMNLALASVNGLLNYSFLRDSTTLLSFLASDQARMFTAENFADKLGRFAGTLVPLSLRKVDEQLFNTTLKDANSALEKFMARIPFLRGEVITARDLYGEPVPVDMHLRYVPGSSDPFLDAANTLGIAISGPTRMFQGQPLTDAEYESRQIHVGAAVKALADSGEVAEVMGDKSLQDAYKKELIASMIRKAQARGNKAWLAEQAGGPLLRAQEYKQSIREPRQGASELSIVR